jgi:hypothetical protein
MSMKKMSNPQDKMKEFFDKKTATIFIPELVAA